jgi:hypothetical protein
MARKGDSIICPNGHICGALLIDVEPETPIVFGQSRRGNPPPFSIEPLEPAPDGTGHVCIQCGERVIEFHNKRFWRVRTPAGWVGNVEP